jgi:hypothetical protein
VAPVVMDRWRWTGGTGGDGPVAPVAMERWWWTDGTGGDGPVAVDRWHRSVVSVNDTRCLNAYPIGVPIGLYALSYRGTYMSSRPIL